MADSVAPCPACGTAFDARMPYPGPAAGRYSIDFTDIELCPSCGLGAALPRRSQAELDAFYAAGTYWNEAVGRSRAQSLHARNQSRHRVQHALAALPAHTNLRVLDVGAGHAWTAYWLEQCAPGALSRYDFVEPDSSASAAILEAAAKHKVTRLRGLGEAEGGYALIFLNHVLEHVADPVALVCEVQRLLAPGGVAYFEMPHADQRFKHDVFPHTWFFTPDALSALATRTGAREVLRVTFGRMPGRTPADLIWRAGFRAAVALGLDNFAGYFDDRLWGYAPRHGGIWLRWLVSPARA